MINMTRICNFPTNRATRCKHPVADDRPNCGRHQTNLSADQLGDSLTVYRQGGALHVWDGDPDGRYCLIHNDPSYLVLCQLAGEKPPPCLKHGVHWYDEHGEHHRDDGPAIIYADGARAWYQHGELHRDGGPAWVDANGMQVWAQHGKRHRDDGPAVIRADGTREWYQHDKLHRDDGPAVIKADGTKEYWRHGKEITEEEYTRLRKQSKNI
jgi:hypothetical protein